MHKTIKRAVTLSFALILLGACGQTANPNAANNSNQNSAVPVGVTTQANQTDYCTKVFTADDAAKIFGGEWNIDEKFIENDLIQKTCSYSLLIKGWDKGRNNSQIGITVFYDKPNLLKSEYYIEDKVSVSGIGDEAYSGNDNISVRKGSKIFALHVSYYTVTQEQLKSAGLISAQRLPATEQVIPAISKLCPAVFTTDDAAEVFGGKWYYQNLRDDKISSCSYMVEIENPPGDIYPSVGITVGDNETEKTFNDSISEYEGVPLPGLFDQAWYRNNGTGGVNDLAVRKGKYRISFVINYFNATLDQMKSATEIAMKKMP